jgi:hypothetical protein
MPDVMEINSALIDIELVQHTIVADPAAQSLVGECDQSEAQFVYLLLNRRTNTGGATRRTLC